MLRDKEGLMLTILFTLLACSDPSTGALRRAPAAGPDTLTATLPSTSTSSSEPTTPSPPTTGSSSTAPVPEGPTLYPFSTHHSPITDAVANRLYDILDRGPTLDDAVFAKVGASSLASDRSLSCFAEDPVELGTHGGLQVTLDHYRTGNADGTTPFDRDSLAAVAGRTAAWVMDGDPSPLAQELDALAPRLALVHYGTNDMGMGATYASALPGFYEAYSELADTLTEAGVIPLLATISHRGDRESADHWVPMYNAVIRGIAQREQVPLIDWWLALDALPHKGLSADGIHVEPHPDGACRLDAEGLEHGYNVRNLLALEALERARQLVVAGEAAPDAHVARPAGSGTADDPYVIDALPFVIDGDTSTASSDAVDAYPACDDADESGPEVWYRLELSVPTPVRIQVLDRGDVDIDVHLLTSTAPEDCVARDHRLIETTLETGSWFLSLDSWTDDAGTSREGPFLLALVPCSPDDASCD